MTGSGGSQKMGRDLRLSPPLNVKPKVRVLQVQDSYKSNGTYRGDVEGGGGEATGEGALVVHLGRRREGEARRQRPGQEQLMVPMMTMMEVMQ